MGMYYGYNNNYSCTPTKQRVSKKVLFEDSSSTSTTKVPQSPQVKERTGCINRNDIGFLLWDRDESRTARWQLGSRLKTPTLPMWVTKVNGSYGVLFNPNKELMRSYAAENRSVNFGQVKGKTTGKKSDSITQPLEQFCQVDRFADFGPALLSKRKYVVKFCLHCRFQLYYFSDAEFKKEERKDTVLTIDTRNTKTRTLNETNNFDDADLEDGIQEPPLQLAIKTK